MIWAVLAAAGLCGFIIGCLTGARWVKVGQELDRILSERHREDREL